MSKNSWKLTPGRSGYPSCVERTASCIPVRRNSRRVTSPIFVNSIAILQVRQVKDPCYHGFSNLVPYSENSMQNPEWVSFSLCPAGPALKVRRIPSVDGSITTCLRQQHKHPEEAHISKSRNCMYQCIHYPHPHHHHAIMQASRQTDRLIMSLKKTSANPEPNKHQNPGTRR